MMLTAEEEMNDNFLHDFQAILEHMLQLMALPLTLMIILTVLKMMKNMSTFGGSGLSSDIDDLEIAVENATKEIEEEPEKKPEPIKTPIKIKTYPYVCSYCNSGFTVPQAHGKCPNCGANMND